MIDTLIEEPFEQPLSKRMDKHATIILESLYTNADPIDILEFKNIMDLNMADVRSTSNQILYYAGINYVSFWMQDLGKTSLTENDITVLKPLLADVMLRIAQNEL